MATLYVYFMEFLGAIILGTILAFILFVLYFLWHDWMVKRKIPQDVKEKAVQEKEKEKLRIQELMKGGFNERKIKEDLHAQEVKRFVEQQGYNANAAASTYSTSIPTYNTTSSSTGSGGGQFGSTETNSEQRRSLSLPSINNLERDSKSSQDSKRKSKRNWHSFD